MKKTSKIVNEIRALFSKGVSITALARINRCSYNSIKAIVYNYSFQSPEYGKALLEQQQAKTVA